MRTGRKVVPMLSKTDMFALAAEARVDWRTIRNEILAQNGKRLPVRGSAGERARTAIRDYFKEHGVP